MDKVYVVTFEFRDETDSRARSVSSSIPDPRVQAVFSNRDAALAWVYYDHSGPGSEAPKIVHRYLDADNHTSGEEGFLFTTAEGNRVSIRELEVDRWSPWVDLTRHSADLLVES